MTQEGKKTEYRRVRDSDSYTRLTILTGSGMAAAASELSPHPMMAPWVLAGWVLSLVRRCSLRVAAVVC